MENNMLIKVNKIPRVEWRNERVMTTAWLAESYETSADNIKQNFKRNRDRFIEGKHFFKLESDDLRILKREVTNCHFAENVNVLYLWTKRGAARHAKMLNTDRAWEVFEKLEDNYFDRPKIDTNKNDRDPLAVERDNSIELLAKALSELTALEQKKFNVENSEHALVFKTVNQLIELAILAGDEKYIRSKLVSLATNLLVRDKFIDESDIIFKK